MSITTAAAPSSIIDAAPQNSSKPEKAKNEANSKAQSAANSNADIVTPKVNTLATALLSQTKIKALKKKTNDKVIAISLLIVRVTRQAIEALISGDGKKVDPLVTDSGCELHALKNLSIFTSTSVKTEATQLQNTVIAIEKMLVAKEKINGLDIFNTQIATVAISDDMDHLIKSRLLTITKKPVMKDGREDEITDPKLLEKTIAMGVEGTSGIVEDAQYALCRSSLAYVKIEAAKITSLEQKPLKLIQEVLDKPIPKKIVLIGCQYFKTKAVLTRLKEMQTLIGIRKKYDTGKEHESFLILYKSAIPGGSLQRIAHSEAQKIAKSEPLIVFDGDVRAGIDREGLAKIISNCGLEKLILANAAHVPQYGYKAKNTPSTLDDVPIVEARDEIREFDALSKAFDCVQKKKKEDSDPIFMLDHVVFDTLGYEVLL